MKSERDDGMEVLPPSITPCSVQSVFPVRHSDIRKLMHESDVAFFFVYDLNNPPSYGSVSCTSDL